MSDIATQHKPQISINRALMDTLDEKVKEAFVDASPSHALSYNSVTKQACSLRPACCQHAITSLNICQESLAKSLAKVRKTVHD